MIRGNSIVKKYITSFIFLLTFFVCTTGCTSESDEVSISSKINEDKQRIVATTVAVVEIMDALDLELVGVPTTNSELPKQYKELTEVGNPMSPDMEIIKSLKPTEVLSVTTLKYDLEESFKNIGLQASYINLQSVGDMKKEILTLGKKFDRKKESEKLVEKYDKKLADIKKVTSGKKAPKVLILLGIPGSYLVATEHSYIGNLVELSGGTNAIQGQNVEFLSSNTEYLHKSNPDIILRLAHGMPKEVVEMFDKEFKRNDIWKHFDAVKNNRVYDLEEELFPTTANLKMDKALDKLVEIFYEQ